MSDKAQPTPGPWEYRVLPDGWGFFPVGATKEDAICGEESDYDPLWSQDPTPENARLIAAAPDMLAALQWIETYARVQVERHPEAEDAPGWSRILAAIAKATAA